jgi:DNA-binding transcriptional regulator YiaG
MSKVACPQCGVGRATARQPAEYEYREAGIGKVLLHGGVTETKCPACGFSSFRIEKEQQLLQVLALGILMRNAQLTGRELRFLRGACQLTQAALAAKLQVRRATVAERESRANPDLKAPKEAWFRMVVLEEFSKLLLRPGQNHLELQHTKMLDEFKRSYTETALQLHKGIAKLKLSVSLLQGELWTIDELRARAA